MEEHTLINNDEINILDILIVLLKRKSLIFKLTISVVIIAAILSLILPSIYRAETRILPPQGSVSSVLGLLSQLGGETGLGLAGGILGLKTPSDLYAGFLKSNTVLDRIIDRFKLMELYDIEYRVDARKELLDNIDVSIDSKSGIITLEVEDKDPERAAQMANAFVEELKNLTRGLAITEASQRRLFFEEELRNTKLSLMKAEEEFKKLQEKTGALKIEKQAEAVIEGIAELRAQIAAKEVELRVMRTYSTPNNPDLQKAEEALRAMKAELRKLEEKGSTNPDPLMPTGRMPEVGIEYIRKLRDMKFNETLYELLTKAYETARLDEAQDAVVIQVIDKAIPPDKRAKPKRTLMVLIAGFSGFFLSVFIAFIAEYREKASEDP
ncbi:MAG: GNVR domain-containing protein, partial [Candidatus Anstonellales archaeon]